MTYFTMGGYTRLYRSMLRFINDMDSGDAAKRVYMLYTANVKSYRFHRPCSDLPEISEEDFYKRLTNWKRKSYRTIVQLYRSMEALYLNIDPNVVTKAQLFAQGSLWLMMSGIEDRFRNAFSMEINDTRTIYSVCKFNLSPRKDEPGMCLLQDLADAHTCKNLSMK